jgi:hypothetical protein
VQGSKDHIWIVSLGDDGSWGCSCPVWRFHRVECHHIDSIKEQYTGDEVEYSETEQQLLTVIKKSFNRIISKRKCFKIALPDGFTVGINNVGIGRVEKSKTTDDKKVFRINDLETYLIILNDKKTVDRIKKSVSKMEKKKMLEILHTHLHNWKELSTKKQEEAFKNVFDEIEPYLLIDEL